jgi:hypothetical protein
VIIFSTRPDGGVSTIAPSAEIMSFFTLGGKPKKMYCGRVDGQINAIVQEGIRESVAVRWVKAVREGGLTDAEAYELIRDRQVKPDWTGHELWESGPQDRWFRNAWRRSPNGGPIYVDLSRARPIQFKHIRTAIEVENKRRADDIDLFDAPIECDLLKVRQRILAASDEIELRMIWPKGVPCGAGRA